jgi:hypothetical protein
LDYGVLRALEDAVDALARLDQQVQGNSPSLATLLLLRTAQTIVAATDRPLDAPDADDHAFAKLLGWWYAPEAREFIRDDPVLRGIANILHAASGMVSAGRPLTLGLLDDALRTAADDAYEVPYVLESTLRRAEDESWPALVLAAELSSGDCGRVRTVPASIARAVAPRASVVCNGVYLVPSVAEDTAGALHALAREARDVRRRVVAYHDDGARAIVQSHDLGRGGASVRALLGYLSGTPVVTVARAAAALGITVPTAGAAVDRLMEARVLSELTGRGRDRVFAYTPAVTLAL